MKMWENIDSDNGNVTRVYHTGIINRCLNQICFKFLFFNLELERLWKFLIPIPIPGPQSLIPIPVPIPAQFDFVDSDSDSNSSRNVTDSRIDSDSGIGIVHHCIKPCLQCMKQLQGWSRFGSIFFSVHDKRKFSRSLWLRSVKTLSCLLLVAEAGANQLNKWAA